MLGVHLISSNILDEQSICLALPAIRLLFFVKDNIVVMVWVVSVFREWEGLAEYPVFIYTHTFHHLPECGNRAMIQYKCPMLSLQHDDSTGWAQGLMLA
jgi:hypothetical protein